MKQHEKLASDLEALYKKHFPHGGIDAWYSNSLGPIINIRSTLVKGGNQIIQNDPMYMGMIAFISADGLTYDMMLSTGALMVNPKEHWLAMSSVKLPWRKTKGNAEKILKAYDTFLKRVKLIVKEHEADVYGRSKYDDKYFI